MAYQGTEQPSPIRFDPETFRFLLCLSTFLLGHQEQIRINISRTTSASCCYTHYWFCLKRSYSLLLPMATMRLQEGTDIRQGGSGSQPLRYLIAQGQGRKDYGAQGLRIIESCDCCSIQTAPRIGV